jgi:hypothetical protein
MNSLDEAISIHGKKIVDQLLSELREILIASPLSFNSNSDHSPISLNSHSLIKFLIARQNSPQKASEMFLETSAWRLKEGVDSIVLQYPPNNCRGVLGVDDCDLDFNASPPDWKEFVGYLGGTSNYAILSYRGGCYHKTDKQGFPLFFEALGRTQPKLLVANCPKESLIQFHIQYHYLFQHLTSKQS